MTSNRWNRFIYRCWAPFYDVLVRVRPIARSRRRAFEIADLTDVTRTLLVGVGTGADLPLLPAESLGVGVDLSGAMLRRAKRTIADSTADVVLLQADAESLPVADASFDAVILTLILSVVPDGRKCLAEALRVLRPRGQVVIMDKFLRKDARPSLGRRLFNLITTPFGTDINRRFEDMARGLDLEVLHDEAVAFGGAYRVIILRKPAGP